MPTLHLLESSPVLWNVLVHAKHGRTAHDREVYNSGHPRMLNVTGRWSSRPTAEVPVLVWEERQLAEDAAAVCRSHRGDGVIASSYGHSGLTLGVELKLFTSSHAPALAGYLPYEATAATKAEVARVKALASAAFLVARATGNEELGQRGRELAPKAGAGAAEYLTGKAGGSVVQRILAGKLAADRVVTRDHVAAAVHIAEAIVAERRASSGFGRVNRWGP